MLTVGIGSNEVMVSSREKYDELPEFSAYCYRCVINTPVERNQYFGFCCRWQDGGNTRKLEQAAERGRFSFLSR